MGTAMLNMNKQDVRVTIDAKVMRNDYLIDLILIALVTALAFGLAYHPYFFGDELPAQRLAIQHHYSFWPIFQGLNAYKPAFLFYGIEALLAKWQASRLVYTALLAGCMVWINVLLYGMVRNLFQGGRGLAWLLVATVLTSRYGIMLYFDYFSGLVELLSTALLLNALLLAWLAWRGDFQWRYAAPGLITAILCTFVHPRYAIGLLAAGFAITIAECVGATAKRRLPVIGWALSFGIAPLLLYWMANTTCGSLPITVGTAGQKVTLGWKTLWCALTYGYNVFLGGNYGHEWFWGHYNYLHPVGRIMGWATALGTVVITAVIVLRRGVAWQNRWLAVGLLAVIGGLIAIASLPGPDRQEARWMFPVGILVTISWIAMVKGAWRHVVTAGILSINLMYLLLGSHDLIANVSASRGASSLASSLQGVNPNGRNGVIVNINDSWPVGGGGMVDMGPRAGDTFSKVNLKSVIHIDPFVPNRPFNPALYDFGLAFDGFGPHRTARYRLVSVGDALVIAGISNVDGLPVKTVLGNHDTWTAWQWKTPPKLVEGAVKLLPGMSGWRAFPVADLDRRWIVYTARAKDGARVPMRLQVNWHTKQDNRFLSTIIKVVYPSEAWRSFVTLLHAPPDAEIGYVYATLHDGAQGAVELKSVELK